MASESLIVKSIIHSLSGSSLFSTDNRSMLQRRDDWRLAVQESLTKIGATMSCAHNAACEHSGMISFVIVVVSRKCDRSTKTNSALPTQQ